MTTHGGLRPNAGRKPLFESYNIAGVRVPTSCWLRIPDKRSMWYRDAFHEKLARHIAFAKFVILRGEGSCNNTPRSILDCKDCPGHYCKKGEAPCEIYDTDEEKLSWFQQYVEQNDI